MPAPRAAQMSERQSAVQGFTARDLRRRAEGVLLPSDQLDRVPMEGAARYSDLRLNPDLGPATHDAATRPAAVLVPIIDRKPEATILLTERTEHLAAHAGQIAFPGGKMDAEDPAPADTALREAREEIGLDPRLVRPIGFLDTYQTVTNFRVAPLVAEIPADFEMRLDPAEVADAFEVPLRFLMNSENHEIHSLTYEGRERYYYAMPYGDRYIWGATAGILHNLYEWLYS